MPPPEIPELCFMAYLRKGALSGLTISTSYPPEEVPKSRICGVVGTLRHSRLQPSR
jgi:hypothetical protein